MFKNIFLAVAILIIGNSIVCNGQEVKNAPIKGEAAINLNGSEVRVKAKFMSGVIQVETNNYVFFVILRDPQTGYVWWSKEGCLDSNQYAPGIVESWQEKWRERFWIIPNIGIVQIRKSDMQIFNMKAVSLEDARKQLIAGITVGQQSGIWPLEQHLKTVDLKQALGEEFYDIPGDARPIGSPNVLALAFTNQTWSIKLESVIAKANRIAVVELDSNYKVLKATRSN